MGFLADLLLDLAILRTPGALWDVWAGSATLLLPLWSLLAVMLVGLIIVCVLRERRALGPAAIERSFFWAHTMPAVLCDINNGTICEANVAAGDLFGLNRDAFVNMPVQRLFGEDALSVIRQALVSRGQVRVVGNCRAPSGGYAHRQLQVSAFPRCVTAGATK